MDPRRDWKVICEAFLVLVVVVLLVDIYFFHAGRNLNSMYAVGADPSRGLDKVRLSKVVGDWKAKEVKFNKGLGEKEVLVDPSL